MKRKISLATLLLLGSLPLGALAAEPTQSPASSTSPKGTSSAPETSTAPAAKEQTSSLFEQLDTNRDGYLTKEEAKRSAEVTARFKELDSDRDGKIAAVEFTKGMQAKL